ncbi:flavodoxin [Sinomonas cellulolyticus]|jgi:flavodoxin|uniref:Flavodoxin-like domain-containing protein n=1 Tax=Sinomonas cellulolyticus TaxID=2801916 RepID=A0ABS1K133_9MICC|nr:MULTISPECIES: flavodoxin family protein [Sinomonas]MBL0705381.1 flavodoxin-like domain-containing protein [Sinomonas cellulolyticus]GHG40861.1 flavodoxin [Sinomonas sp. KCTC 49339]
MEAVVVYASQFGNTRMIAEAIARGIGSGTPAVDASGFSPAGLRPGSLLVVGSPIVGWRPLEGLGAWLDALAPGSLAGIRTAAFDTRVKLFIHGDAAKKIEHALEKAGARRAAEPSWYYVAGQEGPLLDGEVERAEAWGRELAAAG